MGNTNTPANHNVTELIFTQEEIDLCREMGLSDQTIDDIATKGITSSTISNIGSAICNATADKLRSEDEKNNKDLEKLLQDIDQEIQKISSSGHDVDCFKTQVTKYGELMSYVYSNKGFRIDFSNDDTQKGITLMRRFKAMLIKYKPLIISEFRVDVFPFEIVTLIGLECESLFRMGLICKDFLLIARRMRNSDEYWKKRTINLCPFSMNNDNIEWRSTYRDLSVIIKLNDVKNVKNIISASIDIIRLNNPVILSAYFDSSDGGGSGCIHNLTSSITNSCENSVRFFLNKEQTSFVDHENKNVSDKLLKLSINYATVNIIKMLLDNHRLVLNNEESFLDMAAQTHNVEMFKLLYSSDKVSKRCPDSLEILCNEKTNKKNDIESNRLDIIKIICESNDLDYDKNLHVYVRDAAGEGFSTIVDYLYNLIKDDDIKKKLTSEIIYSCIDTSDDSEGRKKILSTYIPLLCVGYSEKKEDLMKKILSSESPLEKYAISLLI